MNTLLVYHYHFRPGGVRSVIERGLIEWCLYGHWDRVVLVTGEAPPPAWAEALANRLSGVKLDIWEDRRLGYGSELIPTGENNLELVGKILTRTQAKTMWAHNLSLGRNVNVALALARKTREFGVRLLCHDHDWWLQHRWERWQEMQAWGVDTLALAAEATFPTGPLVRHAVVHPQDARVLGGAVRWIPNPVPRAAEMVVSKEESTHARRELGNSRYWLMPARVLRRKNLLEAALLMKLLRPECTTLLVAGPASPAEERYAKTAVAGAASLGITLKLGIAPSLGLSVPALMQTAEMVLQTSVQEGFGLTALEASQQGKPLILRRLPLVTDWLEQHGGNFPHSYGKLSLPEGAAPANELLDWQNHWFEQRCPLLPSKWRAQAEASGSPDFSHFSGLSVRGQMAVLENFPDLETGLHQANPWLESWRGNLAEPAVAPICPDDWPQQMESIWETQPTVEGSSLAHLEILFRAHLSEAGTWPMLW